MEMHTPCYVYDLDLLRRTLAEASKASKAVANSHIHYAMKANSNPTILREISREGFGVDCVSGGEIALALECGFKPEGVEFAGVGKTDEEILFALHAGIGCFNVEGTEELEVISQLAVQEGLTARVALRINPNVGAHTHANITTGLAENKFGINLENMEAAVNLAVSLPGIEFLGLHFHIGSQILDMTDFQALCNRINELQEWFINHGVALKSINVGGGLGIDYQHPEIHPIPDFKAYFDTFATHLHLLPGQEFHCEPGRSIVGQCGSLISRCTFVKKGSVKNFVILDAGMNDLVRPAMYQAYHKIENISSKDGQETLYDVVGPICESSDCFSKGIYLPKVTRGDLLAIRSAGAYGEAMASTYNTRKLPSVLFE